MQGNLVADLGHSYFRGGLVYSGAEPPKTGAAKAKAAARQGGQGHVTTAMAMCPAHGALAGSRLVDTDAALALLRHVWSPAVGEEPGQVAPADACLTLALPVAMPDRDREQLAAAVFEHLRPRRLGFVDAPVAAVAAVGASDACVVDVGSHETRVVAVQDGAVVRRSYTAAPWGGQAQTAALRAAVEAGDGAVAAALSGAAPDAVDRAFVPLFSTHARVPMLGAAPRTGVARTHVPLPDGGTCTVDVPLAAMDTAAGAVFNAPHTAPHHGLAGTLLSALRGPVGSVYPGALPALLLCGAGSMAAGFDERLMAHLAAPAARAALGLAEGEDGPALLRLKDKANAAYLGASMLCQLPTWRAFSADNTEYHASGPAVVVARARGED